MDPFALTEESFRSLKAQAVEKLAAARGESAQQLKAASKADPSGSIKQQLEALARRALSRAQIKRVAGLELAERHGFPTVGHLSQHAATCPADEKAELLAELNELVASIITKRRERSHAMWQKAKASVPFALAAKILREIPVALAEPVDEAPAGVPWAVAAPIPVAVLVDDHPAHEGSAGDESGSGSGAEEGAAGEVGGPERGGYRGGMGRTVTLNQPHNLLALHFKGHFSRQRLAGQ